VVANGDITTPEKAKFVLDYTGADAVMIGRAAQGRPWICREIDHYLRTGEHLPAPLVEEVRALMNEHLPAHYAFYGEYLGVRTRASTSAGMSRTCRAAKNSASA
jgi:tRNA-dihydrouridine synthase B